MSHDKKVIIIKEIRATISALIRMLETENVADGITPEGRILSDVLTAVKPLNKRVKYAVRLAKSHK